jgi:MFS family permease
MADRSDGVHGSGDERLERILADEPRNLLVLALSTILIRVGWIFKVESVIMPAFLDSIAGAGWIRGLLPVMNRLGQSVPPFLLSRRLKLTPRKRSTLLVSALGMAAPFGILAALLWGLGPARPGWLPLLFLLLYGLFFASTGINGLALGTLQGKLVRAHRRGRLLALASMGGALPAIGFAVWLLPGWLARGAGGWPLIFAFTCASFVLSAGVALAVREPPDDYEEARRGVVAQLAGGWQILRSQRDYRRLVIVGVLFTTMLLLIPHYQALGRERLGLGGVDMMMWVIAQTAAGGIASVLFGPIADRYGNRLSLRLVASGTALVPCMALAISALGPEQGGALYPLVFFGLGMMPIGFRLISNYILELAPEAEHPRYLSLFQLCAAAMVLWSPLFGWLIDRIGYTPVFLGVSAAIGTAAFMTFGLVEPRHRERDR